MTRPDGTDAVGGGDDRCDDDAGAVQAAATARDSCRLQGRARTVVMALAAAWSVFQLALPSILTLNRDVVRAVHLSFALALIYLCFPFIRRRAAGEESRRRLRFWDVAAAIGAAFCAAYYALDYEGIAGRAGLPLPRDYVVGIALILFLLEAARRSVGPALPVVSAFFVLVCFLGPELPSFLAFKRVSLSQLVSQLTLSTEGVYGVPLGVSASMVYLFVLFGTMLEKSGAGRFFVDLAFSLLGRFRGGPAKAAVLASGLTGLVSGSSIANTVTTGTFTIPLMKRCGYPPEKAAAVEVAASTNGQLMPPIMGAAAFIIAERCNVPYIAVVRAAFIPAVVSYLALMYITHLEACKLGLQPLSRDDLPRFRIVLFGGVHFLIPLVFLVVMLLRRFSPEAAAFRAIVVLGGLVAARNAVRVLRGRSSPREAILDTGRWLYESLARGGFAMMGIAAAVAAAGIIVGVMTLGPGGLLTALIARLAGNNVVLLLLITAAASLVLGMGLPTTANYIVISTLTAPAILTLGKDMGLVIPVLAAHLFCFFFGILADDTPPVGLAAYAASAIAGSDPIRTGVQGFLYDMRTALLPFMFVFNQKLLLMDVSGPFQAALVFATALPAMFAFANLTQNWLVTRNRLPESLLLAVVIACLFRPDWFARVLGASEFAWTAAGVCLYAAVAGVQYLRARADSARRRDKGTAG